MKTTDWKRPDWMTLAFAALGGALLLFILAPLLGLFLRCSPGGLASVAGEGEVLESIWLTLWVSMTGTLLFAIAAIPFAWVLARKEFPLKGLVNALVDLPIVIPHSAAGIALVGVLSRKTWAGKTADLFGIELIDGHVGIMLAMAFVSLPFLVNAARDGFLAVPERLEKAAMTLGTGPLRVFFTVSLPLAGRAILSGLVMMWARGMSEFGAVLVVAYHPKIAPVLLYDRFMQFGLDHARPVVVLFLFVCFLFFVALRLLAGRKDA